MVILYITGDVWFISADIHVHTTMSDHCRIVHSGKVCVLSVKQGMYSYIMCMS